MFSIHSNTSSRELVFSESRGEHFRVELKGLDVSAQTDVWVPDDMVSPSLFLQELAGYDKPWPGDKSWRSPDDEFSILARCSVSGTVMFQVQFRGDLGGSDEWLVRVGLVAGFGQLKQFAQAADVFFKASNN